MKYHGIGSDYAPHETQNWLRASEGINATADKWERRFKAALPWIIIALIAWVFGRMIPSIGQPAALCIIVIACTLVVCVKRVMRKQTLPSFLS